MHILEPNMAGVITSVRSIHSPNLVQISCEMASPHGDEIQRFVTFFVRLFSFFPFPRPAHMSQFRSELQFIGSKVVFRLIHVSTFFFGGGLVPSNSQCILVVVAVFEREGSLISL